MRRRWLSRTLASLFGTALIGLAMTAMPSVAGASETTGSWGYIEICKTFTAGPSGSPMYRGTFVYNITDSYMHTSVSVHAVQGGPQVCTAPILVPAGTATVTEVAQPWFSVASITGTQGDPGTVTASSSNAGTATLQVLPAPSPGNTSLTTTVQYVNDPVTGIVEVCKQASSNSPSLTGTYGFNITSVENGITVYDSATGAYDLPWSTTGSATISTAGLGCSGPIIVPAGTVQTVEPGTTYVTSITASSNGANELVGSPNLAQATSYEHVNAGDTTNQTIVTYTDALSTVKLCKAWTGSYPVPTTMFPFSLSSSGAGGPTAVTGTVGLSAGSCQIVGMVRAGTQVNITEGVVPGTKVDSISVNPTLNSQGMSPIVPGTLSLPNRTVSVIAGAGETDVTFTDRPADPGMLKICVAPNPHATTGTAPFTVNGTQLINVNLSTTAIQCTLDPTPFAFNSSVSIAGGSLPSPLSFMGTPTVVPTMVQVLEGGAPTPTNQATLTASTASSAKVLMSEGIVTEVTFYIDPPAPVTAPTQTATPTVSQVAADSASLTGSSSSTQTGSTQTGSSSPVASPAVTKHATKHVSAHTLKLRRQLKHERAMIKRLRTRLASKHLSAHVRKADRRKLTNMLRIEHRLVRELR